MLDNLLIKCLVDVNCPSSKYETNERRPWKNFNVEQFKTQLLASNLCNLDHTEQPDDTNLASIYHSTISTILDQLIPISTITCRRRVSDPWFDDDCRQLKRRVRRLERCFRRTLNDIDHNTWTTELRIYRRLLINKRTSFWVTKIKSEKSTPRKLWQSIDKLLGRHKSQPFHNISADDFLRFFEQKVSNVRSTTEGI